MLGDQDSNLNKQNQNLLCYRYTIPQDGRRESIIPRGVNANVGVRAEYFS